MSASNVSYPLDGGTPSTFAQQHIVNGMFAGEPPAGDPGYSRDSWGGDPATSATAALVLAQFDARYPGGLAVGISAAPAFR